MVNSTRCNDSRINRAEEMADWLKELSALAVEGFADFATLYERYLETGCRRLGLSTGILSHIQDQSYQILAIRTPLPGLAPGDRFELTGTYCVEVCRRQQGICYSDVAAQPALQQHPVYLNLGLRSYIGAPIRVRDHIYGTLNFSDLAPRVPPFEPWHLEFIGLMARALGQLIERDEYEQALRQQKRLFKSLFRDLPDPLVLADEQRRIFLTNPAVERTFGYSPEQLLGQSVALLYADPDEFERIGRKRFNPSAHEVMPPYEAHYRRRDGSTFTGETVGTVVRDDGGRFLCFLGHIRDITERKEVERVKNDLISVVSHELRTPLTSILGSLALVKGALGEDLPPQVRNFLTKAHHNSERLAALVDDLLDMERLASGRMPYRMEPQDLPALVWEALDKNADFAARYQVELACREVTGCRVEGDSLRLGQVFNNLLSNAIKFSPAGGTVEVAAQRQSDQIRVTVADRGPGVPAAFRGRIFQRFSQADASATRARGGTGLGLAISRAIVEAHGGSIGYEDRPGGGTVFWFELPLSP